MTIGLWRSEACPVAAKEIYKYYMHFRNFVSYQEKVMLGKRKVLFVSVVLLGIAQ